MTATLAGDGLELALSLSDLTLALVLKGLGYRSAAFLRGLTAGELAALGPEALAAHDDFIYAGTDNGLVRFREDIR